ncbi:hypothetical protein [uncultured Odoribacter sp.]|uniref:hypothetical protein n=1 Tax=uncultured Odoribacter sp. TaxID=876416 RepID=UPI0026145C5E|nr:hypothetical protein [uncultured Odoribacter sp.]
MKQNIPLADWIGDASYRIPACRLTNLPFYYGCIRNGSFVNQRSGNPLPEGVSVFRPGS